MSPQHTSDPFTNIAHVNAPPTLPLTEDTPPMTTTGEAATAVPFVPWPSCPLRLVPQHSNVPVEFTAHVWDAPTPALVTPVRTEGESITPDPVTLVYPSPSCPDWLSPQHCNASPGVDTVHMCQLDDPGTSTDTTVFTAAEGDADAETVTDAVPLRVTVTLPDREPDCDGDAVLLTEPLLDMDGLAVPDVVGVSVAVTEAVPVNVPVTDAVPLPVTVGDGVGLTVTVTLTVVGAYTVVALLTTPFPSSPYVSSPQHDTAYPLVNTHVWNWPAVRFNTPDNTGVEGTVLKHPHPAVVTVPWPN